MPLSDVTSTPTSTEQLHWRPPACSRGEAGKARVGRSRRQRCYACRADRIPRCVERGQRRWNRTISIVDEHGPAIDDGHLVGCSIREGRFDCAHVGVDTHGDDLNRRAFGDADHRAVDDLEGLSETRNRARWWLRNADFTDCARVRNFSDDRVRCFADRVVGPCGTSWRISRAGTRSR